MSLHDPLVVCSDSIDKTDVSRLDWMIETCEALASKRTAYRVDRNLIETERRETSVGGELTLRTIGLVPRARALDVHEI